MIAPTLTTDRLILRAPRREDFESYAATWADPDVTRYIGGAPRDRMTSWKEFLQGAGFWPILGFGRWTIEERATGAAIGSGGLFEAERGVASLAGHVEAGWAFGPAAWGKGYATEAMAVILAWGDAQGITETRAIIDHSNTASARVAEKLGFTILLPTIPEFSESALWQRC
jgi:RimJ/RimL family protein N-acetyltransferase